MKKIIFHILFTLFIVSSLKADCDVSVKGRVAAFFPTSDRFKKIYGNCVDCYEFEASAKFSKYFEIWFNYDWISKSGQSYPLHDYTHIFNGNFSWGAKYLHPLSRCLIVYGGLGPSFGDVKVYNHADAYHEKLRKYALGGVLKTGVYYSVSSQLFLDLFFDYFYQPSNFKTEVDLGGSKLGVGLGCRF